MSFCQIFILQWGDAGNRNNKTKGSGALSALDIDLIMTFCSYHETYLNAEERCNEHGAYLADVLDQAENDFIKVVLRAVNPKDGTDYWWVISRISLVSCFIDSFRLGAMDMDRNKNMQWLSGKPMTFTK